MFFTTMKIQAIKFFNKRQNFRLVQIESIAGDKINVTKILKFVLGRVENFVGKGENDGNQHFLLFLQCFKKASYTVIKIHGCVV